MNSLNTLPYVPPVAPDPAGIDADKLTRVITLSKKQRWMGEFPGGQFVVRRNGKLVINETVGIAHRLCLDESTLLIDVSSEFSYLFLSIINHARRFVLCYPLAHNHRHSCRN
jgi:hypothetical protein